jgi:hypothetical protein
MFGRTYREHDSLGSDVASPSEIRFLERLEPLDRLLRVMVREEQACRSIQLLLMHTDTHPTEPDRSQTRLISQTDPTKVE